MAYPIGEIIYSGTATNPPIAVASISTFYMVDEAASVDTVEQPNVSPPSPTGIYGVPAGNVPSYNIVFIVSQNKIVWKYAVKADRDNCYAAIVANYGYQPD